MDISHCSECKLESKITDEIDHYRLEHRALSNDFDLNPELENLLLLHSHNPSQSVPIQLQT